MEPPSADQFGSIDTVSIPSQIDQSPSLTPQVVHSECDPSPAFTVLHQSVDSGKSNQKLKNEASSTKSYKTNSQREGRQQEDDEHGDTPINSVTQKSSHSKTSSRY